MGGQGEKDPPDPPDGSKNSSNSSTNTLMEEEGAVGGATGGAVGGTIGGARPKTPEEEDGLYDQLWATKNSTFMNLDKDQNKSGKSVTEAKGPDGKEVLKRRYAEIIANAEEAARGRQSIILKLNKVQDPDNSQNIVQNLSHEEMGI